MIIKCGKCRRILGARPPYEKKGIVDSICPECASKELPRISPGGEIFKDIDRARLAGDI